tara:strand:+ start:322 stop:2862 length:2541 start_codon:yes stop_codon:yes gene_type:complete
MSQINVNTIRSRNGGPPNLDKGAVVTGIVTATSAEFAGNVSVGGTLTYEDVTNIDSTGIVTAKSGIFVGNPVSPGIGATINPNGNAVFAGILTANSLRGDGSLLTGIDATAIQTGNTSVQTVDTGSDGHVKMTTEGSERVRVGPAGQIGLGGANYGTTGQLLTSSGSGSAPTWTSVSSAPQVEATADGAITAGDTVIVNTNGTVKKVTPTYTEITPVLGTYTRIIDGYNKEYVKVGYDSNRKQALFLYRSQNGNSARMAIGTIAGGLLTLGSEQEVEDTTHNVDEIFGLAWSKTSEVGVALYKQQSKVYAEAFTNNGSTLSFGSKLEICDGSGGVAVSWDSAADKFLVVVGESSEGGSGDTPDAYVLSHSGTTLSSGTRVEIESPANMYRYGGLAYDEDNNKHIWTYRDNGDSGKLAARILTVSGTTVLAGSEVVESSVVDIDTAFPVYITGGKFVVAYIDGGDVYAKVITVSGTTPTFGAQSSKIDDGRADNKGHQLSITYDLTGKVVVGYILPSSWSSQFRQLTIDTSANTITAISGATTIGGDKTIDAAYSPDNQMNIFGVQKSDSHGYYRTAITSQLSTNVTLENYLGVANASASDTATATIDVSGATNSSQSTLTPGQNYYVQNDGSLGLTAADPKVYAGTAVSATKLLVGKQSPTPGSWEVVSTHVLGSTNTIVSNGWSNEYAEYKVVFDNLYGSTSFKIWIRVYTDATSGNLGTLQTGSTYGYGAPYCRADTMVNQVQGNGYNNKPQHVLGTNMSTYNYWSGYQTFPMKTGNYTPSRMIWQGYTRGNYEHMFIDESGFFQPGDTTHHLTGIEMSFWNNAGSAQVTPNGGGRVTIMRLVV